MGEKDYHECLASEDPVKSTVFMDKILKRFNIDLSSPESQVSANWALIVGSNMSSLCSFGSLKDGILTVFCTHPTHASAVRMNKNEILKNIKSIFPELKVTKLEVRIRK